MPEQGKPGKEHTYRSLLWLDFSVWIRNALYLMKNCSRCFILFEPHLESLSPHHKTQETEFQVIGLLLHFVNMSNALNLTRYLLILSSAQSAHKYSLRTSYRLGAEGAEGLILSVSIGAGVGAWDTPSHEQGWM